MLPDVVLGLLRRLLQLIGALRVLLAASTAAAAACFFCSAAARSCAAFCASSAARFSAVLYDRVASASPLAASAISVSAFAFASNAAFFAAVAVFCDAFCSAFCTARARSASSACACVAHACDVESAWAEACASDAACWACCCAADCACCRACCVAVKFAWACALACCAAAAGSIAPRGRHVRAAAAKSSQTRAARAPRWRTISSGSFLCTSSSSPLSSRHEARPPRLPARRSVSRRRARARARDGKRSRRRRQFGKFLGGNKQFTSSNADERKKRSDFYDDERDTVNRRDYMPNFVEQSEENDLATQGLGLYAAFIPFLLFCLAYSNGLLGFGYSNGNF